MKIDLESVSKRFQLADSAGARQTVVTAVDAVSLSIAAGELFFLVGPSGCGKTTLLRLLAGFGVPDNGRILFNDICVNNQPAHQRNTGMVFQNYALWPHMSVGDNVAFGLTVPGRNVPTAERRERVSAALRAVRMEEYARRKPGQLSGGQQQRVALARALVIKPDCLLLDEPLSNLDAKLRLEMRREIRNLVKKTGITTIYVTHDQEEALSMADRCAIMRAGQVEQVGTPRELYYRPVSRFVADFIGNANVLSGTVRTIAGQHAQIHTTCGEWQACVGNMHLAPGQSVAIGIRPEAVRFNPPLAGGINVFNATLQESLFCGDRVECRLALSDDVAFKALLDAKEPIAPVNGRLQILVAPEDVILMRS